MNCPSYEGCSAPICPRDKNSIKNGIWYPDEPICSRRGLDLKWLAIQKRIAKRAKNITRYFTFKDFQRTRVQNPRGHNPDRTLPQAMTRGLTRVPKKIARQTGVLSRGK